MSRQAALRFPAPPAFAMFGLHAFRLPRMQAAGGAAPMAAVRLNTRPGACGMVTIRSRKGGRT
ncbi:hypothetical protein SAMN05421774_101707 [Gemmobacter megaterium]|uniref:Uncharacterized protein n=1 Tax=Gemmobacter megaterium TaxID=1086013 RepID=A0A1N7KVC8_9RHOB|nr:hypothetical protein SAMN05421774_101707 [Gemmobacter megaterium]